MARESFEERLCAGKWADVLTLYDAENEVHLKKLFDFTAMGYKSVTSDETQAAARSCLKRSEGNIGDMHIFEKRHTN